MGLRIRNTLINHKILRAACGSGSVAKFAHRHGDVCLGTPFCVEWNTIVQRVGNRQWFHPRQSMFQRSVVHPLFRSPASGGMHAA